MRWRNRLGALWWKLRHRRFREASFRSRCSLPTVAATARRAGDWLYRDEERELDLVEQWDEHHEPVYTLQVMRSRGFPTGIVTRANQAGAHCAASVRWATSHRLHHHAEIDGGLT